MVLGGGIPTRRRSNSTSGGGGESSSRSSARPGSVSGGSGNVASSRPKRRGRGLPLIRGGGNGNSTPRKADDDVSMESPSSTSGGTPNSLNGSNERSDGKRTSPRSSRSLSPHTKKVGSTLTAIDNKGKPWNVTLLVGGQPFVPVDPPTSSRKRTRSSGDPSLSPSSLEPTTLPSTPLGHDGNLFHCHVCNGFGDVVCCDGCPDVYHRQCIPEDDPSRISLDNDEDPWFCPSCYSQTKIGGSKHKLKEPKKRTCCECQKIMTKSNATMKRCSKCEKWMHFPPCRTMPEGGLETAGYALCSRCADGDTEIAGARPSRRDLTSGRHSPDDGLEFEPAVASPHSTISSPDTPEVNATGTGDRIPDETPSRRRRARTLSVGEDSVSESVQGGRGLVSPSERSERPKKRRRPSMTSSSAALETTQVTSKKIKDKTKKKKKKKKKQPQEQNSPAEDPVDEGREESIAYNPYSPANSSTHFKATPAFYFYLAENRLKIERSLSRKHRIFNRLPKGYERNELVAKEGAIWWTKLRPSEVRRYMIISMRDFEQRIIEWKEEKNIREMLTEADLDTTVGVDENGEDWSPADEASIYENHQRLYLGTTVGSKPFKPELGISHNRVLLELLQDMRFHPVPMLQANRTSEEYGQMDFARITIPYFDVHGPISTSVGDECLGCTRGWTHVCNVLKRRVPAIEHRAKLQPPLSSLVATRVGLGLRPRPITGSEVVVESEAEAKNVNLFAVREVPEVTTSKNLPVVPCDSLSDPSSRADDIVQFIEEAVAMKVPEPPRPAIPYKSPSDTSSQKSKLPLARAALPIRNRKLDLDGSRDETGSNGCEIINKCGRCRTVIQTDTGCVQCRRAQLVINMSKRGGRESPVSGTSNGRGIKTDKGNLGSGSLKVQTYMLGRVTMKEGSGEVQSDGEQAIAAGILRQMWTPFTILPPQTLKSPTPKPARTKGHGVKGHDYSDMPIDEEMKSAKFNLNLEEGRLEKELTEPMDDDSSTSSRSKEGNAMILGEDDASSDERNSGKPSRASSKRLRSARVGTAGPSDLFDDADRQKLAERYKKELSDLNRRCLSVACCGILLALMRRDPLLLFAAPVTAEGYSAIIKNPIDFGKIRSNVLAGKYGTLGAFVSDCRRLCTNALAYNPPGSIYWKTAKELFDVLAVMQKRASGWIHAVKDAHAFAWRRAPQTRLGGTGDGSNDESDDFYVEDPFSELRKTWPEAVEMFEEGDWLRKYICADFMRTKENETAYYGALAARRAATASEASLAAYPDTVGFYNTVSRRSHQEDENLRAAINQRVSEVTDPVQLKDIPTWREESIVRVMRRAQSRRLEGLIGSKNGCARCDGMRVDQELKMAMTAETVRWGRTRRKNNEVPRVHPSRIDYSTGLASQNTRKRLGQLQAEAKSQTGLHAKAKAAGEVAVTVRGSRIHGWGLFADQHFKKGDVVAEYIGEYVSLAVTEAREKMYQEQRIQDYQFKLDAQLVIDATMRGGHGRYINHNCSPNCAAKIIPGPRGNENLKRVIITAQRDIKPREELSYDYQFPLELDLDARIPCNCHSEHCRGFMNWDLPEKGSNNRIFRSQKRGANMRDRIRRLGRPLKGDKDDKDEDDE